MFPASLRPMPRTLPTLLLLPVFDALEAWLTDPGDATAGALGRAIADVGERMGLTVADLVVSAPPLPELHAPAGPSTGQPRALEVTGGTIGTVVIDGPDDAAATLTQALATIFAFARERARANRSAGQLRALESAVRGIGGTLDQDRVLKQIADEVRVLADARYAAIGIVDRDGVIVEFFTSGMTDAERAAIGELPRGRGLLGALVREARTLRIADITTHPGRYGFPPNHPVMSSFLGVPIKIGDDAVGRMYLTDKIGAAEFSADDEALVETFALHAGLAIQQARLHDQVRRLAIVDERERISRDLHDSSIQAIYAQTLSLDDVPDLVDEDPDEARRRVDDAIDALHAVINDIRSFIFGLRPVLLESGGIVDGLEQLATELRRSSGVEVTVSAAAGAGDIGDLPIDVVVELLAVTREALSNIARHAGAERASVTLDGSPAELRLAISDDGHGFDVDRPIARGHLGLANMRARVAGLSGTLNIDSDASGTRIIVTLPRPGAPASGA